jgi:hypothetical protein
MGLMRNLMLGTWDEGSSGKDKDFREKGEPQKATPNKKPSRRGGFGWHTARIHGMGCNYKTGKCDGGRMCTSVGAWGWK